MIDGAERHRPDGREGGRTCFLDDDAVVEALAAGHVGLCHIDPRGQVTLNPEAQAMLGHGPAVAFPVLLRQFETADRRSMFAALRKGRSPVSVEGCLTLGSGDRIWLRIGVSARTGHCSGPCLSVSIVDVTAERAAFEALKQSEEHLRLTVEYNPQLPWIADPQGQVIDVNQRWLDWSGLTREQALGAGWLHVAHPEDAELVSGKILHAITTGERFDVRARLLLNGEYRWIRAQGYPRFDADGKIVRWYGYTEDIHEVVLVEERIRWNAEHDPLTGLLNRTLFNSCLEKALRCALQNLSHVAVLLVDLDRFKEVNDLLGHHSGDKLLQDYADQLRDALPPDAVAARLGGDEFAVLFPDLKNRDDLARWADIVLGLRPSVGLGSGLVDCRSSIGIAIYPEHGRQPSELLRHADIALYAAKDGGRGKLLVYEAWMQDEVRDRAAMISRARRAAEEKEIVAFYQPKVCLKTGQLAGFEALLRWRDPAGKIHAPASIAAAFEETDVADQLGHAMLRNIVRDLVQWRSQGLPYGHVALNAAPAEFKRTNFAARLIESISTAGLAPSDIEVEITEGVFLGRGADYAKAAIQQLSDHGTSIALDDFGTGFASLSHLRALPVNKLKIDRSFIAGIADEDGDATIVKAIVDLGHNLGIQVIAEGIETPRQAEVLCGFGCDFAQGYFYGRPMPAEKVPALILQWRDFAGRSDAALPAGRLG